MTAPAVTDAHVHVNRFDLMRPPARALIEQNPTFPLMQRMVADPAAFLEHLDQEGVRRAWLINYCAKQVMGYGWEVNAWAAEYAATDPSRLVATGGYDPRLDGDGERAAEALRDLGIRAVKVHPVHQAISAGDASFFPFYAALERLRMPVIVHTGTSRFPGADNSFADPLGVVPVLERFPRLPVILAHGGRPDRTKEALALLRRFPNAWLEISGCPPHRLVDYFGDLAQLASRTLWGSDWPGPGVPGMRKNVDAFLALGLGSKERGMVLHANADSLIP
ncbi:MAG TPA: amidohydrolase family protein [Candidatus Thermoplasmatota archaeon]|nr:amidohydrolase family protein [Candidatus Thermoplasmatota archaeon]